MAIVMKVGGPTGDTAEQPKSEPKPQASMEMVARKSLDGNIMILDHSDIDIVVMPSSKKVLTISKGSLSEDVYDTQDRLFRYLSRKGVVDPGSVRSGNVYGSMEAAYVAESYNGSDSTEVVVFDIGKFLEEEKAYYEFSDSHESEIADLLTKPNDATDLGDVDQEERKGSINPHPTQYKVSHPSASPFYQE